MLLFYLMIPPHLRSTLFPYTTLFRSRALEQSRAAADAWSAFLTATALKMVGTMAGRWFEDAEIEESAWLHDQLREEIAIGQGRSEEHTSELQSHVNLVCRLLLEKKKN